jgi:hypothetical protein
MVFWKYGLMIGFEVLTRYSVGIVSPYLPCLLSLCGDCDCLAIGMPTPSNSRASVARAKSMGRATEIGGPRTACPTQKVFTL